MEFQSKTLTKEQELSPEQKAQVIKEIKGGASLEKYSDVVKNNKEVVMEAVYYNCDNLQHASKELQNDKEVVLEAIKDDGYAIKFASQELRNDKEIILAAIEEDRDSFELASKELQQNPEFLQELVNNEKISLSELEDLEIINNDRNLSIHENLQVLNLDVYNIDDTDIYLVSRGTGNGQGYNIDEIYYSREEVKKVRDEVIEDYGTTQLEACCYGNSEFSYIDDNYILKNEDREQTVYKIDIYDFITSYNGYSMNDIINNHLEKVSAKEKKELIKKFGFDKSNFQY